MSKLPIQQASENDILAVTTSLILYNNEQVPFTQNPPFIPINLCIKNGEEVIGGILAQVTCWNILSIEALWVKDEYRGNGYARQLMKEVEDKAIELNCTVFHLDTFDFQAKDFYESIGYSVFGQIEDCPTGHTHYYLVKKLV